MKRDFLSRVRANGRYFIVGAVLLLVGIPLYQFLILQPLGYSQALTPTQHIELFSAYLLWIRSHMLAFLGYRFLLILSFIFLLNVPFTLFRIIVAQEVLEPHEEEVAGVVSTADEELVADNGMPPFAWRGKGYAVIAAWAGLAGIALYALGTFAGTIYLAMTAAAFLGPLEPPNVAALSSAFTLITYTIGGGFLALALLFFGAVIARRGRRLWPTLWVAFAYGALVLAALFSGSAVSVANAPDANQASQATITTPSLLLFSVWVLWFGVMLVRLKPEQESA